MSQLVSLLSIPDEKWWLMPGSGFGFPVPHPSNPKPCCLQCPGCLIAHSTPWPFPPALPRGISGSLGTQGGGDKTRNVPRLALGC